MWMGGYGRRTATGGGLMIYRPRHLSISSVATYVRCPAVFRQRYVDRLVTPTTGPQGTGTAFHKALEAEHRGEDSERAWIAAYNAMEQTLAATGETLTISKSDGLELLNEFRRRGLGGKIGIPERKFVLPFPSENIPVPFLGYIDLSVPLERHFRDYKTTAGTAWTETKAQLEPQLHGYGWAYQKTHHHRAEYALWVIFNTKTLTVDPLKVYPSPDGFRLFERQAEATWAGIEADQYDGCGEQSCELCTPPADKPSNGPSFDWEEA